ncbi:ground-like domain protein [Necator americanus]|uniref:Ground-like domain protein n=1 Tax=Necator americanus TaxID=51031 RepID=W2SZ30_NECAM|nr:ground-like domain protein [Necator americanus]ETN74838.1 ground-like domain protein [Necator americanus]
MIQNFLLCLALCVEILIANDNDVHKMTEMVEKPNKVSVILFGTEIYGFFRPLFSGEGVLSLLEISDDASVIPGLDNQVFRDEKSDGSKPQPVNEFVEDSAVQESVVDQFFTDSDPTHYHLPERPFPNVNPYAAAPPLEPKQKYPLPQCYTNESGFMCCNSKLEQVMRDTYDELSSDPKWQSCNVQKIANTLQNKTQTVFNMDFEALVGLGDFASKSHFYSDLICKVEVDGRFLLSYATPNRHRPLREPYKSESVDIPTSSTGYN